MQLSETSLSALESPHPWKRMAGGWLFSAVIHFVLTLIAGMLFVASSVIPPAEEPVRETSLVLVRSTNSNQVEYFSQDDAAESATSPDGESQAQAAARANAGGSAALPDQAPQVDLPSLPSAISIPGTAGLISGPQISGNGGGSVVILPGQDDAAVLAAEAAAAARIPPKGPTSQMSLFGSAAAVGNSFVFVIDRSKSMGGDGLGAIEAASRELEKSLGALTAQQRFQVIAYNEQTVFLDGRRLLDASDDNRERLLRFVSGLAAFGPTEHEIAIVTALTLEPDVIFFLSDGGDPELNSSQMARILKMAGGKTAFHTIQFGYEPEPQTGFMRTLATATRGSYVYIRVR